MCEADVLDVMLCNATAALVQLQYRADRHEIELANMWPKPDTLPSAEDRHAAIAASWAEAIERGNQARSKKV